MDTTILSHFFEALQDIKEQFSGHELIPLLAASAQAEISILDEEYFPIFDPMPLSDLPKESLSQIREHLFSAISAFSQILDILNPPDDINLFLSLGGIKDEIEELILEIDWVE